MRRLLPVIMLVLLATSVSAANAKVYWTVVYDDAPASDVVSAANFAASMKGSAAVTFRGKTFSQASGELVTTDLAASEVVIFDGDDVTIMTADEESLVARNAEAYLLDQGFDVAFMEPSYDFFNYEEPEEPEDVTVPMPLEDTPDVPEPVEEPQPEPEPEPQPAPAPQPEPEQPNVIV